MWFKMQDRFVIRQLEYNFLPSWWHANYGLVFGERMVFDPDYRIEAHMFMERTVRERFPGLDIGSENPRPTALLPSLGNAAIAAAAGCEVVFPDDNYPWNHRLPTDRTETPEVPSDLSTVFPYSEIDRQARYVSRRYGIAVEPLWPTGGVLNNAVIIFGDTVLADLVDLPDVCRQALDYSFGMTRKAVDHNRLHGWRGLLFVGNCTVTMVSPETYQAALLRYDLELHDVVRHIGAEFEIHHCGVLGTHARAYRSIPQIDFLEVGWTSDIRAALDLFPESLVQYIVSPVFMKESGPEEVRACASAILDASRGDWHRFSVIAPDLEHGTPEENLYELYACMQAGH